MQANLANNHGKFGTEEELSRFWEIPVFCQSTFLASPCMYDCATIQQSNMTLHYVTTRVTDASAMPTLVRSSYT